MCCLLLSSFLPSRALQPILLCFEAVNRCEIILRIHFDSVSSNDYGKLNIGEGHHSDTGAHLKIIIEIFLSWRVKRFLKSAILTKY